MRRFVIVLVMSLLFACAASAAADPVEDPKACKQCGMDRDAYARSRMVVLYGDGTAAGVCSLHCAVAEMRQNREKHVVSLKVADYSTHELIDARTAVWVIGGRSAGVMTSEAKWAFAREKDAREFIKENGGKITGFDEVKKAAESEAGERGGMTHRHRTHSGHGAAR